MKPFELTREAKEDLRKIAKYTEIHWGRDQRNLYAKQFDDGFHLLAESPSVGKQCDYIKDGYRKFPPYPPMVVVSLDSILRFVNGASMHHSSDPWEF